MDKVTIIEVNAAHTVGRQVHPEPGGLLEPAEFAKLATQVTALATWNCNGEVLVSPARGATNLVHKLPLQSRDKLYRRIGSIVTNWYPRQDVIILLDPIG